MTAVKRNNVRTVHYLLVSGADPNYQEPHNGMTPLHIAAHIPNVAILKLLLAFEADIFATNKEGKTPLDIAKDGNNEDCIAVMEKVASLRDRRKEIRSSKMTVKGPGNDSVTLLSMDGGGTRGSACCYTLYYIEQRMREIARSREEERTEAAIGPEDIHIRRYFDWYAGTSIGSLFTNMMVYKNGDTNYVMSSLVNSRMEAFSSGRIYDGPKQEKISRRLVGEGEMRSISNPKVLITTTQADLHPPQLICITNYRGDPGNGRNWKAWEAARASSSAPLFFPSFEGRYVDGGILAVNPTQHALHDIHVYDNRKIGLVLSLGTGVFKPAVSDDGLDVMKPRLSHFISDIHSDIKFLKSLLRMLTANILNPTDTVLHSKAWCESIGAIFHRLSPPLSVRHELDEKSDEAFVLFFYETYLYLLESEDVISKISYQLLDHGPRWRRGEEIDGEMTGKMTHGKKFKSTWV